VGTSELSLAMSPAWTGSHDFGGASSLEMINKNTETIDAPGEFYLENDEDGIVIRMANNGGPVTGIAGGEANVVIPVIYTKSMTILEPDLVGAVDTDIPFFSVESYDAPNGIVIVQCQIFSSSNMDDVIELNHRTTPTGADDLVATVDMDTSTVQKAAPAGLAAATVNVDEYVTVEIDNPGDNVNWMNVTIWYYVKE